jgi:hypothetical protein
MRIEMLSAITTDNGAINLHLNPAVGLLVIAAILIVLGILSHNDSRPPMFIRPARNIQAGTDTLRLLPGIAHLISIIISPSKSRRRDYSSHLTSGGALRPSSPGAMFKKLMMSRH